MAVSRGWAFRASATATGTTSLTISKPTGTLNDDIMVMSLVHKGAGYATVPAGWTLIAQNISGSTRGEVYWKRASSEGSSYSVTGLADTAVGAILSYEGGLLSGNVVSASSSQANAAGQANYAAFTPADDNCLILFVDAIGGTSSLSTFVTATDKAYLNRSLTARGIIGTSTTTGTDCRLQVADGVLVKSGGTYSATISGTQENVRILVALKMEPQVWSTLNAGLKSYARFYDCNRHVQGFTKGELVGDWTSGFAGPKAYGIEHFDILLSPTKHDGRGISQEILSTNVEGGDDMLYKRYWIGPCETFDYTGLTLTVNFAMSRHIEGGGSGNAYPKIHAYVTQGATTTVRQTLIDNLIDSTTVVAVGTIVMRGMTSPTALPDFHVEEGDYICIELGFSIPNFVALAPPTYQPSEWLAVNIWNGQGASNTFGPGLVDGNVGESLTNTKAGWIEFNWPIAIKDPEPAPLNDSPTDAFTISSLPYVDSQNTTNANWVERSVYYKWTAPSDMRVIAHALGSNYPVSFDVFTGSVGSFVAVTAVSASSAFSNVSGSRAYFTWDAVSGTTYYIRACQASNTAYPKEFGGDLTFELCPYLEPGQDDIFYPCSGTIAVFREGQLINISAELSSIVIAGVAVDYTKRPMTDYSSGSPTTHTDHRLILNAFTFEYVEVLDLKTLNLGDAEIDFSDGWDAVNSSTLECTNDGILYSGAFGDGFKLVSSNLASFENSLASPSSCKLNVLDAVDMQGQSGAPFTPTTYTLDQDVAGIDYISLSIDETKLLYTSSGQYMPVGGTRIMQWDIVNNVQLPDFATVATGTGPNPSLKGIRCLPDGGVLICNGRKVDRLDAEGTVVQTYTPSDPNRANVLADVDLVADGTAFWVMDADTASFWKFDLESGAELNNFWTHMGSGNSTSFVVYRADVPPLVPITPEEQGEEQGCVADAPTAIADGTACWVPSPSAIVN